MTLAYRKAICLLTLVVVFAGPSFSATLDDYQRRIDTSFGITRGLIEVLANEDAETEADEILQLRRLLPRSETIDIPGGPVETDNGWLSAAIDEFVTEVDQARRSVIILAISERLAAISQSVAELKAASAAERSKEEDKQKLAEILGRAEFQKAQPKEESLFQKWWLRLLEWLASAFPQAPVSPTAGSGLGSLKLGLQILVFSLVIILIGFFLWRLAPLIPTRFGRSGKKETHDRVVLGERIGADQSAADIFSEAELLALEGDHRGAIRKGYIALLCELGDRNVVRLAYHKTNRDYLRDVQMCEELFENMSGLTGHFERSWYGLRLAEAGDWASFRDGCRRAISLV